MNHFNSMSVAFLLNEVVYSLVEHMLFLNSNKQIDVYDQEMPNVQTNAIHYTKRKRNNYKARITSNLQEHFMCVHEFLNLLNELGKKIKCQSVLIILSLSRNNNVNTRGDQKVR